MISLELSSLEKLEDLEMHIFITSTFKSHSGPPPLGMLVTRAHDFYKFYINTFEMRIFLSLRWVVLLALGGQHVSHNQFYQTLSASQLIRERQ